MESLSSKEVEGGRLNLEIVLLDGAAGQLRNLFSNRLHVSIKASARSFGRHLALTFFHRPCRGNSRKDFRDEFSRQDYLCYRALLRMGLARSLFCPKVSNIERRQHREWRIFTFLWLGGRPLSALARVSRKFKTGIGAPDFRLFGAILVDVAE